MSAKIAIIGAGSGIFSLNLIKDLCLTENLADSHICFMDISKSRLDAVYKLCSRFADEVGTKFTLSKTTDRRECLKGADFVIDTALPGGYEHLRRGWEIAKKWGYRFGGSLHILHDESFWMNYRQLGLMERILCDMGELCPDAWLIMVSNPVMAGITYLGRKYPRAKVVGMCHGFHNVYGLADKLGLERDKISFEIPGVNHFVWLNRFFYEGKDAFPLLDRWIKNESKGYFATCKKSDNTGPKAIDLYRRFGVFPIGDTGNPGGGSWGWEYHTDEKTQALWNEDPDFWYDDYFRRSGEQAKKLKDTADNMDVRVTDVYSRSLSPEPMVPLLEALACDISRVVVVNTMNTGGFVEGVPLDFEVEIPAVISAKGVQGLHTKPLPKAVVSHMQRDRIAPVNIELAAYENRSRSLLLELILLDPWTRTRAQAEGFLEEILAMPGNEDMAEHYR